MRKPAVNVAVAAVRKAAQVIVRSLNRLDTIAVEEKRRYDFVSEVDRQVELELVKELKRAYPDHAFLAEESGRTGDARYVWCIDPLDGTSNFLRGFPHFCISVALLEDGVPIHGVIYDPIRDELFTASKGSGAFLNDHRLRVGQRKGLEGAVLTTGFPFRQRQHLPGQLRVLRAILGEAEDVRRTGSAALDLAYVAAGRVDGFWELGLSPWDMAAGALMVREAGGACRDYDGQEQFLDKGTIVAGNVRVVAQLLAKVKSKAAGGSVEENPVEP
ncbi:MAG: inositol monophosphatase [Xanthomonadales bacterium]|nr:inositol monophosphatase [Xanthomonadales bacterium]